MDLAHVRNCEPVIGRHCLVCGDDLAIHVRARALCLGYGAAIAVYRRDNFHSCSELDPRSLLARVLGGQKSRRFRHATARRALHLGDRVLDYKLCNYPEQLDRKMCVTKPKVVAGVSRRE